jgi:hypothetical protein
VYVVVPYQLLYLELKLLSARLFQFSIISQPFGAINVNNVSLGAKGRRGERSRFNPI